MSESFTIHGTWDSVPVDYTRTYAGDKGDQEGEYMQPDDLVGAKALLEGMGWTFPSAAPAQPVQIVPQGVFSGVRQQQQPPFGSNQMSWQCPVHGMTKVKAGYQGRGFECGVTVSGQQPQYPTRQWQGRQGEAMYTCAMRSS